jgi:hypothetical protein
MRTILLALALAACSDSPATVVACTNHPEDDGYVYRESCQHRDAGDLDANEEP